MAGRRRRRFQRRLLRLLVGEHLVRRLHLVGLMPEEAGKPAGLFLRLCGRLLAVQGNVDGGPALALSPPLGRLRRSDVDGGRRPGSSSYSGRFRTISRTAEGVTCRAASSRTASSKPKRKRDTTLRPPAPPPPPAGRKRRRPPSGQGPPSRDFLQKRPSRSAHSLPCENGVEQRSCQQRQQRGRRWPAG